MRDDPYTHCPRLPREGPIDPRRIFLPASPDANAPDVDAPVELEIGPGRGWFTVERLELNPSARIVGLEIKRKWATIVDGRLIKRGLAHRGRIFAEDVRLVLPRFSSASVSVAYLHFPDPWWKKRHRKRLVLTRDLLTQLSRVLVVGGELFVQTDVPERADEYEKTVGMCPGFAALGEQARVDGHPFLALSPRERKAMESGLPVIRLRYRCLGPFS